MKKYIKSILFFLAFGVSGLNAFWGAGVLPFSYDESGKLIVLVGSGNDEVSKNHIASDFGDIGSNGEDVLGVAARALNEGTFYHFARMFDCGKSLKYSNIYDKCDKKIINKADAIIKSNLYQSNFHVDVKDKSNKDNLIYRMYFLYVPFFKDIELAKRFKYITKRYSGKMKKPKFVYFKWVYPSSLNIINGLPKALCLSDNKRLVVSEFFFDALNSDDSKEILNFLDKKTKKNKLTNFNRDINQNLIFNKNVSINDFNVQPNEIEYVRKISYETILNENIKDIEAKIKNAESICVDSISPYEIDLCFDLSLSVLKKLREIKDKLLKQKNDLLKVSPKFLKKTNENDTTFVKDHKLKNLKIKRNFSEKFSIKENVEKELSFQSNSFDKNSAQEDDSEYWNLINKIADIEDTRKLI